MDTVIEPQPNTQPATERELRLLMDWSSADARPRQREAAIGSIAAHVAFVLLLLLLPKGAFEPARRLEVAQRITPLVVPHFRVTQPNVGKGKPTKTISLENLLPRPATPPVQSPPSTTRPAAQHPGKPFVAPPTPAPAQAPQIPEPPKIEASGVPKSTAPTPAPPPQIQPEEKPKLAFETPGAAPSGTPKGPGKLAVPGASVTEAIRGLSHGDPGGVTVGDSGAGPGGLGPGINRPPSAGKLETTATILSDQQGVDFRPYMLKVLTAVKRNWFAVYPESARLGTRGKTALVITIDRSGGVPSLKIAVESGVLALDRAAVAGVSASTPFPPLPSEFHGSEIRLQLVFAYNLPIN